MNTKHTPGPWKAAPPTKNAGNGRAGRWSVQSAAQPIADVLNDRQEANARLIAAAPEQHEKGERLCDVIEAYLRKGDDAVPESLRNVTETVVADALYDMRAALAEARGDHVS
jgi:hypothetical protein